MYPVTYKFVSDIDISSILTTIVNPFHDKLVASNRAVSHSLVSSTTDVNNLTTTEYVINYPDEATFLAVVADPEAVSVR